MFNYQKSYENKNNNLHVYGRFSAFSDKHKYHDAWMNFVIKYNKLCVVLFSFIHFLGGAVTSIVVYNIAQSCKRKRIEKFICHWQITNMLST